MDKGNNSIKSNENLLEISFYDPITLSNNNLKEQNEILSKKVLTKFDTLKQILDKKDYSSDYASLILPFDKTILIQSQEIMNSLKEYSSMIVVGIGGSNLGTKSLYDLFKNLSYNNSSNNLKELFFLETVDVFAMNDLFNILSKKCNSGKKVIINVVTKSGGTTETIFNFALLNKFIRENGFKESVKFVLTTTKENSLYKYGKKNNYQLLTIPSKVGGRYSVFSSVGIFPLVFAGIDVSKLLEGARDILDKIILNEKDNNFIKSSLIKSVILMYNSYSQNREIFNQFFFVPLLKSVGDWYRQLISESSGKEFNVLNEKVNVGIVPIISVGSTDLHSMVQLFLSKDKAFLHRFVDINNKQKIETFLDSDLLKDLGFENLKEEVNYNSLMEIIKSSVKRAFKNRKVPFMDFVLKDLSEFTIGAYMQFCMLETIIVSELLEINPFNQPNVEEYKVFIKELLN